MPFRDEYEHTPLEPAAPENPSSLPDPYNEDPYHPDPYTKA